MYLVGPVWFGSPLVVAGALLLSGVAVVGLTVLLSHYQSALGAWLYSKLPSWCFSAR